MSAANPGHGNRPCEEFSGMYELYALGVLEAEDRAAIDEHLSRNCTVCTQGVRRALAVNAAVLSLAPETNPPKRLKGRVMAAVEGRAASAGARSAAPSTWAAWWPAWALASAALALVSFVLYTGKQEAAVELADTRRALAATKLEAGRAKQILDFLNQPETKAVGFSGTDAVPPQGNFFVNRRGGVLLIASHLPRLDAGRTYQMWVIPKGQNPQPAGLFRADEQGGAIHLQAGPVDVAAIGAVAVSVEPDGGSAQPTTKPIIVAPVSGL